jgi:hypothetical protein
MTTVELDNLRKTFTLTHGWGRKRTQTELSLSMALA